MDSTIRRTLWGAFFVLTLLVAIGLGLTVTVLQIGRRQESRIVHGSEPLLDAVGQMDEDVRAMLAASRGFLLTKQTQFLQQYAGAVKDFAKASTKANRVATSPQDSQVGSELQ